MKEERKSLLFGVGGAGAALASALCCAGPLLAVAAGVSGAGLAATFDPLRPWFLGATGVFLLLRPRATCRKVLTGRSPWTSPE